MRYGRRRIRRAFTLLEVLLVLVIIGLLAGIVAPQFFGIQKQQEINTAKAQIELLEDALNYYRLNAGTYPTTEQGLQALLTPPTTEPVPKNWAGPYLETNKALVDPWGTPYFYQYPGQHNTDKPDIWSAGPDRQPGTEDDITNWSTEG